MLFLSKLRGRLVRVGVGVRVRVRVRVGVAVTNPNPQCTSPVGALTQKSERRGITPSTQPAGAAQAPHDMAAGHLRGRARATRTSP